MSSNVDDAKGRVKEAAGALTDDDKLRTEGQIDQTSGKVKQVVDKAVDKTKQAVKDLKK
jgi:uncharacterized protein YjbJ (UPF0337 family)